MYGKKENIDETDRKILNILLKDANTSYVDIAKQIHVSPGTVHVRMKRLVRIGIVKKAFLNVDYNKLGYDICAFLGIHLENSSFYSQVVDALYHIPEVVNAHYTTGNYSIFVRIICRDTEHLREVLHEKIQEIPGVQRTETFISLEESIHRTISLEGKEEQV
ncbi:Lrp/AsnC ligand binding domain-containing protein [Saprospira sp. CCB-QB6]|uniref:Lrp/AsnC ligand binding domain-containing protein n=1 Tax=Saprospira sp. CCB-QB6 TaxID=3023936 RepID=UPI0023494603|nr:Lrp/AsnC ligand binding domain-containing protein [Saprospira sp. CCB-QB6]WCL81404.1 Lrp/AsnC ligand binding domain-containing protein [Saprospira sp. CCB-QB6]